MGFFKRLTNAFARAPVDEGIYIHIKLDGSDEIVRLRLIPKQELNADPDQGGYYCRKMIVGPRSFKRAEALFRFDAGRQLVDAEIDGGTLVEESEWQAHMGE